MRPGQLRSGRAAVLAYFVILGLTEGIWVARIPGLKARLHLTDGLLGAALLVGPAGLILVMPLAGRLADRFGSARLTRQSGLAVAVLPVALWRAGTLAGLPAALCIPVALGVCVAVFGYLLERPLARPVPGVTGTGPGRPGGSRSR